MKLFQCPIIDYHASWIAFNPIIGCPFICKYCFLNEFGLTNINPRQVISPMDAVDKLVNYEKMVSDEIPICFFTATDAFASQDNIKYLKDCLILLDNKNIINPKIFITKCYVPDSFLQFVKELEQKGHKFIFFISYSGIGNDIEQGINLKKTKDNFVNLKKNRLDIIHYFRPLLPGVHSLSKMVEIFEFVKNYANSSVVTGLKVQENMKPYLGFLGAPKFNFEKAVASESVWDAKIFKYVWEKSNFPTYSRFISTSCAVANLLEIPDYNGFYGGMECSLCICSSEQRERCKNVSLDHNELRKKLTILLKVVNLEKAKYKIFAKKRKIFLYDVTLTNSDFAFLTQNLKCKVMASQKKGYYWGTSIQNNKVLKIRSNSD